MSGIVIETRIDDAALMRAFDTLIRRGGDPRPALEEIGDMLIADIQGRFMREEDPEGHPWAPSRRAEEEGGQTLTDNAILRNSFTKEVAADSVTVGTAEIYAAIHNFGGIIEAKNSEYLMFESGGQVFFLKKVEMPQREFMGITDENCSAALDILKDYLERAL